MNDLVQLEEMTEQDDDGLYYGIIRIGGFKDRETAEFVTSGFHDIIADELAAGGVNPLIAN